MRRSTYCTHMAVAAHKEQRAGRRVGEREGEREGERALALERPAISEREKTLRPEINCFGSVVYAYPPYDHAFRPDSDPTNDNLDLSLDSFIQLLLSIAVVSRLTSYSSTRSLFSLISTCYICPFFKMAVRGHYERARKGTRASSQWTSLHTWSYYA